MLNNVSTSDRAHVDLRGELLHIPSSKCLERLFLRMIDKGGGGGGGVVQTEQLLKIQIFSIRHLFIDVFFM